MDATHAIDAVRSLDPDAIRRRLAELDGEQRALRTLLRAALAQRRAADRRQRTQAVEAHA